MGTNIITINLGQRSYDIYIGKGLLERIADLIPLEVKGRKFFIICDKNVVPYADSVERSLKDSEAAAINRFVMGIGEQEKSFANVETIVNWLLDVGVNRDSVVLAIGGGVVGDLAGFCASITMRGIPYVQVPTTLLAQVDSSVGGKTAVNTGHGKNLVGSFYQPLAVVADIETLQTLDRRELRAGYAEIVKYGLIRDSGFFAWLEANGNAVMELDFDSLIYAIEESVKAKAEIVEEDETERGSRALLNLGHTFAHALETAGGYKGQILHGEAVAIGICMAFDLSCRLDLCSAQDLERVERHFESVGLKTRAALIEPPLQADENRLYEYMKRDKKVEANKIRFILADNIGGAFISEGVDETIVKEVLRESLGGAIQEKRHIADSFAKRGVRGLWKSVFSSQS